MFSVVPFRTNLAKYNIHYDMQSKLLFTRSGQNSAKRATVGMFDDFNAYAHSVDKPTAHVT